ncbi:rod shape-determining protein MreC [Sphingomonas caeni]|uniref:rod shape-determining protein MreC n=1 Tax=Sphingomonas caeni TaxID=2984949 RepID=UPI0029F506F7|nr:rod shape-determining protein MreC [Sphingomonas caeni]
MGAVGGALIGAALLLLSTFNPPAYAAVRGFFAEITTPVSSGLDWIKRSIAGTPAGIAEHWDVKAENDRLKKELADNNTLVERARTLNQENRRLRAMLKLRDATTDSVVAARLVNSSASSTRRYATLNAGSWQGVKRGQPVREPDGLIGQVIEVGPNSARVLLIIDSSSNIPVRRTRDGLPAIATGRGDGQLDLKSAAVTSGDFKPGDLFVTSGTGGIFPPNIPVARVVRAQGVTAIGQPAANPDALDFALVQQPFLPEPTPSPSPTPGGAAPK